MHNCKERYQNYSRFIDDKSVKDVEMSNSNFTERGILSIYGDKNPTPLSMKQQRKRSRVSHVRPLYTSTTLFKQRHSPTKYAPIP